jgi:hypothetical protein
VNSELRNNTFGLRAEDRSVVTVKDTTAAANAGSGFIAFSNAAVATVNLDGCVAIGNGFGINATNANAFIRFANCTIAGNNTGIASSGGGHTVTFTGSNNNADTGTATDSIARQ